MGEAHRSFCRKNMRIFHQSLLGDTSIRRLDTLMRQWERRFLSWPAGTPSAAVLGELDWDQSEKQAEKVGCREQFVDVLSCRRASCARVSKQAPPEGFVIVHGPDFFSTF